MYLYAQTFSQNDENKNILRTSLGLKLKKLRTSEGFKNFRRSYKKTCKERSEPHAKRCFIIPALEVVDHITTI